MRKALVIATLAACACGAEARGIDYVYEVLTDSGITSYASSGMVVAIEAMRLYQPTAFERDGSHLRLSSDGEAWLSFEGKAEEIWREGDRRLVRYKVKERSAPRKPAISRRLSVRFSLAELESKGGAYRSSPMMYALRTAIERGKLPRGTAWIESARFSKGTFTIGVAFSR